ncbi:Nucleolar complex protein [Spatholobus suberectus]|nr:Nucleolar complex protein [Spatholobus suberectus]
MTDKGFGGADASLNRGGLGLRLTIETNSGGDAGVQGVDTSSSYSDGKGVNERQHGDACANLCWGGPSFLVYWWRCPTALPVVSFLFMRHLCIRIGSGCIDECFKGIYKAYVLNCHFVNAVMKLKNILFLGNWVIELFGVVLPTAYQHALIYIGNWL